MALPYMGRAGERGDRVRVCDVEAEHGAGEAVLVLGLAELLLHVPPRGLGHLPRLVVVLAQPFDNVL